MTEWQVPTPRDKEFVARVHAEIAEADRRARETLGIEFGLDLKAPEEPEPPQPPKRPARRTQKHVKARREAMLHMLMAGYRRREIAAELDISPNTVNDDLRSLRKHYGARNVGHLIALATMQMAAALDRGVEVNGQSNGNGKPEMSERKAKHLIRRLWRNRAKHLNSRARMYQAEGHLTPNDLREIVRRDESKCVYCDRALDYEVSQEEGKGDASFDHIIRLCDGGSNTYENIVCSCRTCNQRNNKAMEVDPVAEGIKRLRMFLGRKPHAPIS